MNSRISKPISITTLQSHLEQLIPSNTLAQWQISPINTGLNNQLWHLQNPTNNQQLICRVTPTNQPLTQNSLKGLALQQQLSNSGISAAIHHQSHFDGITLTLMDFIQGSQQSAHKWSEKQRQTFAKQLASLHQTSIETPLTTLDISAHLNDYLQQLGNKLEKQQLADYQIAVKEISIRIKEVNREFSAIVQQRICHNDLNRLNIVYAPDKQRFVLLDWDEARLGDHFFDLAGFTIEHQLTQQQSHQWLSYYFDYFSQYNKEHYQTQNQPICLQYIVDKHKIYQQAYQLTCELWHHLHQPLSHHSNASN